MREIRRVELKRLRINSATKLQVWWKLMILLQKIRIRTAKNLAAKQEKSAKKYNGVFEVINQGPVFDVFYVSIDSCNARYFEV